MKNLFTITELERDTTEEMITFTLEVKDKPGLIQGQIKYELKKGTETDLSSFSGLNDSHGYTDFTTFDLILDPKSIKFYNEDIDEFTDKILYFDSITQAVIDRYMLQESPSFQKSLIFVAELIWESVDEAIDNNVASLLEGES
jgi:hypothetical protein